MRKNIQYKYFLPLVILVISMLLQGCKDDVFNPEKVKAAYQDKFPVKDRKSKRLNSSHGKLSRMPSSA